MHRFFGILGTRVGTLRPLFLMKKKISLLLVFAQISSLLAAKADDPKLINVQFGTSDTVFQTGDAAGKDTTSPSPHFEHFSGNEGVFSGGTHWNVIQPSKPSPNYEYGIGDEPLEGEFPNLADAEGKPCGVKVVILPGVKVSTTPAKNDSGFYLFSSGYQALMNSYLSSENGTIQVQGLEPNQSYDLALFGHGASYQDRTAYEGTVFKIGEAVKATGSYDLTVERDTEEGNDYVVFKNVSSDSSGTIAIEFAPNKEVESPRGCFNGFQLRKSAPVAPASVNPAK